MIFMAIGGCPCPVEEIRIVNALTNVHTVRKQVVVVRVILSAIQDHAVFGPLNNICSKRRDPAIVRRCPGGQRNAQIVITKSQKITHMRHRWLKRHLWLSLHIVSFFSVRFAIWAIRPAPQFGALVAAIINHNISRITARFAWRVSRVVAMHVDVGQYEIDHRIRQHKPMRGAGTGLRDRQHNRRLRSISDDTGRQSPGSWRHRNLRVIIDIHRLPKLPADRSEGHTRGVLRIDHSLRLPGEPERLHDRFQHQHHQD